MSVPSVLFFFFYFLCDTVGSLTHGLRNILTHLQLFLNGSAMSDTVIQTVHLHRWMILFFLTPKHSVKILKIGWSLSSTVLLVTVAVKPHIAYSSLWHNVHCDKCFSSFFAKHLDMSSLVPNFVKDPVAWTHPAFKLFSGMLDWWDRPFRPRVFDCTEIL